MYGYFTADLRQAGAFEASALSATTERHWIALARPPLHPIADVQSEFSGPIVGAVFEMTAGLPSPQQLDALASVVMAGRRAWLYWPAEQAVECVDDEQLESWRAHRRYVSWLERVAVPFDSVQRAWRRAPGGLRWIYRGEFPVRRSDLASHLDRLVAGAQPVPLAPPTGEMARSWPAAVSLCLDYWHGEADKWYTDVLDQLASLAEDVVGLAPHSLETDQAGWRAVALDPPPSTVGQDAIVSAPAHYLPILKAVCQALAPSFIYERLSLGQSAGAELSQLLRVPYVAEYAGTQAIVAHALGGAPPFYPELYARAEDLALRQATVVVVPSESMRDDLVGRGIDSRRVLVATNPCAIAGGLIGMARAHATDAHREIAATGDAYKDRVQDQWNANPVGSHYARASQPGTLDWFLEIERHRYQVYARWMPEVMEFSSHAGHDVLEIGGGLGTDLAQFAKHGSRVTDVDLASEHLELARTNFALRGLSGRFVHHDAETLPFDDSSFDLVYSNGVLHHTPNTRTVVREIHRVLRPGGRAIVMLYAQESLHYWRKLVWELGVKERLLDRWSMGEIMSRAVERSANDARPLVKVYTRRRAAALFAGFKHVEILQRQMEPYELPRELRWVLGPIERRFGWNVVIKATKA